MTQSCLVPAGTQTRNDTNSQIRQIGMMPEGLALIHVGQMHFDERYGYAGQGIAHGNAGMREGGSIDDDEIRTVVSSRMDTIDQLAFVIGLKCGAVRALP